MLVNRKETRLIVENWRRVLNEEDTNKEVSQIIDKLEKVNTKLSNINYKELLSQVDALSKEEEEKALQIPGLVKAMNELTPENITNSIAAMFTDNPELIKSLKNENKILFINNYNLLSESFIDKIKSKVSLAIIGLTLAGSAYGVLQTSKATDIDSNKTQISSVKKNADRAESFIIKFLKRTNNTMNEYLSTKKFQGRDAARIVLIKHSILKEIVKKGPKGFKDMSKEGINSLVSKKFNKKYPEEEKQFAEYLNIHLRLVNIP